MFHAGFIFAFFISLYGLIFAITGCDGKGGRCYERGEYWRNFALKMLTMTLPGGLVVWLIIKYASDANF